MVVLRREVPGVRLFLFVVEAAFEDGDPDGDGEDVRAGRLFT